MIDLQKLFKTFYPIPKLPHLTVITQRKKAKKSNKIPISDKILKTERKKSLR